MKTIEMNREIIKDTKFIEKNGKYYICHEIPKEDFNVDKGYLKKQLELNNL